MNFNAELFFAENKKRRANGKQMEKPQYPPKFSGIWSCKLSHKSLYRLLLFELKKLKQL